MATEDERDAGLKQTGHVATGAVKIVLTLNFDQLAENAIRDAGAEPVVLSSPDAIAGSDPLQHQETLVVHLDGDYLSPETLKRAGRAQDVRRHYLALTTPYPVPNRHLDQPQESRTTCHASLNCSLVGGSPSSLGNSQHSSATGTWVSRQSPERATAARRSRSVSIAAATASVSVPARLLDQPERRHDVSIRHHCDQ
jgi:hypothetical protein